jgi:iron complex outermembrane recepter protein
MQNLGQRIKNAFVGDESMMKKLFLILLGYWGGVTVAHAAGTGTAVSERDYLTDVPVVLSVSRLSQRLDDTPGALTILDRDFIQKTGARDVADLLRLVPGFQTTTSFEADAPMASYHGRKDSFSNRIQVLVDGRPVYSGHMNGAVGAGLQTLAIDDIERIEVLRGSNSAAYGARAFLGVINIVSRDVRETLGTAALVSLGDNGVTDAGARVGWGDEVATFRLSVDSRQDDGLRGAFGKNHVQRANLSSHWILGTGSELDVRAGYLGIDAGRGTPSDIQGNQSRMRFMGSQFVQASWRLTLNENEDISVIAAHTETVNNDKFFYLDKELLLGHSYYGTLVDFSATEYNDEISAQYTKRWSESFRFVVGSELRSELIVSPKTFRSLGEVRTNFGRLFGNTEWWLNEQLVLNLGAMAEHSDIGGDTFSPRIMANWHVSPGHTLRAGWSTAFRPPSAFEKYALVQYYDINGQNPLTSIRSQGMVTPEKVATHELGYYFNLSPHQLEGDIRLFHERITDGIYTPLTPSAIDPKDFRNLENYSITGGEYQLTWRPVAGTRIFWNQAQTTVTDIERNEDSAIDVKEYARRIRLIEQSAAKLTSSLAVMHSFSSGWSVSLMHQRIDDIGLISGGERLFSMQRTDVRLAKAFRLGKSVAEWALTVQNSDAPVLDGDRKFYFDPRAFLTLRIEH